MVFYQVEFEGQPLHSLSLARRTNGKKIFSIRVLWYNQGATAAASKQHIARHFCFQIYCLPSCIGCVLYLALMQSLEILSVTIEADNC